MLSITSKKFQNGPPSVQRLRFLKVNAMNLSPFLCRLLDQAHLTFSNINDLESHI